MARPKTTGKFSTREELVDNVLTMVRRGQSYPATARCCGVSTALVFQLYHMPEKR